MKNSSIFFRRIEPARQGERAASYSGIGLRCLWFWLVCFGGVAAYLFIPAGIAQTPLLVAAAILALACPIAAYLFPLASAVLGSVYGFAQGFLLAQVCTLYAGRYKGLVFFAAGITVLIFLIALLLYQTGIIKVNQQFRAVAWTLFIATVIGSGVVYISSFFTTNLTSIFWGHGPLAIILCIAALVLATINLVFEFDFAAGLVQQGVQSRYEWAAAYGLFMTIIAIFLRVLELLAKTQAAKERS